MTGAAWSSTGRVSLVVDEGELHAQPFATAAPAPDPQRINLLAALIAGRSPSAG